MVGEIMGTYGIGVSTLRDRHFLSSPRFISAVTRAVPLYSSHCGAWMRPGSWDLVIRLQARVPVQILPLLSHSEALQHLRGELGEVRHIFQATEWECGMPPDMSLGHHL